MLYSIVSAATAAFVVVTLGIVRKYREKRWGKFDSEEPLTGRVYIVTGANCGIGKETTRELVRRDAKVIMACRDIKAAKEAIVDIRKNTSCGEMVPLYLDLESLDSIKIFVNIVLHDFPKIDALINNAGVSMPASCTGPLRTEDGFELHFQVNYLGHFILTKLLLPRLIESAPSRIVIVSSMLHERGRIDFDNLNGEKGFRIAGHANSAYCDTKLMNAYFAYELQKKLENTGVAVYALCPGFCKTQLMRYSTLKWYHWPLFVVVVFLFMRSAKQGCQTVLQCALAPQLQSQASHWFYRDCKTYYSKHNFDDDISSKLWKITETMVQNTKKVYI